MSTPIQKLNRAEYSDFYELDGLRQRLDPGSRTGVLSISYPERGVLQLWDRSSSKLVLTMTLACAEDLVEQMRNQCEHMRRG